MKKLFILSAYFLLSITLHAQKISGLWYSSDSKRIYEIKQTGENKFTAVIKSSTRKTDSVGFVVMKDIEYNYRRKRYEGFIYDVKDDEAVYTKIKFRKNDSNRIILKLSRMFIFDVLLYWQRVTV